MTCSTGVWHQRWQRTGPMVALLLSACAHGGRVPDPPVLGEYRLGRSDLVEVQVWKEPALSATVPVRPDGRVTLPMAGELLAEGRTPEELSRDITLRLSRFVPDPSVTVMVHEVRAPRVFVLGEVAHPGAFPLAGPLSVLEAVALAGGTTEFARRGRVVVIRRQAAPVPAGAAPPIRVDLGAIVDGKVRPLELVAGDTVYVP